MDVDDLELDTTPMIGGRADPSLGASTALASGTSLSNSPSPGHVDESATSSSMQPEGARNRGRSLTSITNPYNPSFIGTAPLPSPSLRPPSSQGRRSRAPTITFPTPLPPVLSRDNSPDQDEAEAPILETDYFSQDGLNSFTPPRLILQSSSHAQADMDSPTELSFSPSARYAQSGSLPSPTLLPPSASTGRRPASRSISHHPRVVRTASGTGPSSSKLGTPPNVHLGLTRRTSTPSLRAMGQSNLPEALLEMQGESQASLGAAAAKADQSRARSTSTSIVRPNLPTLDLQGTQPITPPSYPPYEPAYQYPDPTAGPSSTSLDFLNAAYTLGESSVRNFSAWLSSTHGHVRRNSRKGKARATLDDDDSEKGLGSGDDADGLTADSGSPSTGGRSSLDWSTGPSSSGYADGYFGRPHSPLPPDDRIGTGFDGALRTKYGQRTTLPTPAVSSTSLSGTQLGSSWKIASRVLGASARTGDRGSELKVTEVARELGWTLAALALCFVVTALMVLGALKSMPITTLRHIPKSVGDLQLLSAEIRTYMEASSSGWWHTVGVLTVAGCFKHAWSVPGAVVLNILVGSLVSPVLAVIILTLITSFGSLGAYTLSRPLAPLIGLLFPKPLALVSAALAPSAEEEFSTSKGSVWRRLLVMRAMGFVPWSGMNVACGVVGVKWTTFVLTTAGGSASWSYVTASVGQILSRLAVPTSTLASSIGEDAATSSQAVAGESLTSLLRDPGLIAKLIILSALSLLPVLFKRRAAESTKPEAAHHHLRHLHDDQPLSPLSSSLATFTPTPRAFDLLSFARTSARQGAVVVWGAVRWTKRVLHVSGDH